MKLFVAIIIFFLAIQNSLSQKNFETAINSLQEKLEFVITPDTYTSSNDPDKLLIERFAFCSTYDVTLPLANLNFDNVSQAISIQMQTSYWKGPVTITLREWKFNNEQNAQRFSRILDSVPHHHVQDIVNKGGIQWWIVGKKIYILTSRAYFATYHYDDIIATIKS